MILGARSNKLASFATVFASLETAAIVDSVVCFVSSQNLKGRIAGAR